MEKITDRNANIEGKEKSQFALMTTRRFGPFFWTQFFGAFNDNVYKNALIIIIAFNAMDSLKMNSDIIINIAAGLFIVPFFLFSATAGQIADKYEKSGLIRRIKIMEIIIMGCASIAFLFNNMMALIVLLFFMGSQSAFFGPIKYSIIPQHLKPGEIVGGNAMVEMGTFLAILTGTLGGGLLCQLDKPLITGCVVFFLALTGWLFSRSIPKASPTAPELSINWNFFSQMRDTMKLARKDHSVLLSILAISWFWLLGAAYLTQIPNFTKHVLNGSGIIITLLLTVFSIGIGTGSLLCEKMSARKVELGLVPLGALGLSIFGMDLSFIDTSYTGSELLGFRQFLNTPGSIRVLFDLLFIGISGGFYIVPLYAFIQVRTRPAYRARIIAANNILNALFMVIAAILGAICIGIINLTIPQFFLIIAFMNIAVCVYIFSVVPEFAMRFLIWIISHTFYSIKHVHLDNIPEEGPGVIVANHVSYVDGLIMGGACKRPIRFVVYEPIYRTPILNVIFRIGKAIPIASKKMSPKAYKEAFQRISDVLEQGELICIFPEGRMTSDGEIHEFKRGIEKILHNNPVPVIPAALRGLWGSFFSRKNNKAMRHLPRRFRSRIEFVVGEPMEPQSITAEKLKEIVVNLRGDNP